MENKEERIQRTQKEEDKLNKLIYNKNIYQYTLSTKDKKKILNNWTEFCNYNKKKNDTNNKMNIAPVKPPQHSWEDYQAYMGYITMHQEKNWRMLGMPSLYIVCCFFFWF